MCVWVFLLASHIQTSRTNSWPECHQPSSLTALWNPVSVRFFAFKASAQAWKWPLWTSSANAAAAVSKIPRSKRTSQVNQSHPVFLLKHSVKSLDKVEIVRNIAVAVCDAGQQPFIRESLHKNNTVMPRSNFPCTHDWRDTPTSVAFYTAASHFQHPFSTWPPWGYTCAHSSRTKLFHAFRIGLQKAL